MGTLRPKYLLYGYMEPLGIVGILCEGALDEAPGTFRAQFRVRLPEPPKPLN